MALILVMTSAMKTSCSHTSSGHVSSGHDSRYDLSGCDGVSGDDFSSGDGVSSGDDVSSGGDDISRDLKCDLREGSGLKNATRGGSRAKM